MLEKRYHPTFNNKLITVTVVFRFSQLLVQLLLGEYAIESGLIYHM